MYLHWAIPNAEATSLSHGMLGNSLCYFTLNYGKKSKESFACAQCKWTLTTSYLPWIVLVGPRVVADLGFPGGSVQMKKLDRRMPIHGAPLDSPLVYIISSLQPVASFFVDRWPFILELLTELPAISNSVSSVLIIQRFNIRSHYPPPPAIPL